MLADPESGCRQTQRPPLIETQAPPGRSLSFYKRRLSGRRFSRRLSSALVFWLPCSSVSVPCWPPLPPSTASENMSQKYLEHQQRDNRRFAMKASSARLNHSVRLAAIVASHAPFRTATAPNAVSYDQQACRTERSSYTARQPADQPAARHEGHTRSRQRGSWSG